MKRILQMISKIIEILCKEETKNIKERKNEI